MVIFRGIPMSDDKSTLILIRLVNDAKHCLRKYVKNNGMIYNEFSILEFYPFVDKKKILTSVIGIRVPQNELQKNVSKILNYFKLKEPDFCNFVHIEKIFLSDDPSVEALEDKNKLLKEYKVKGW